MNYRDKLAAGFVIARNRAPYFDAILTGMVRYEVKGLAASSGIVGLKPTMGVTADGILMYEREAIEAWTVEEIASALLHEVGHLLRNHAKRCKDFNANHDVFNLAGDAEINDDIVAAGWELPGNPFLPSSIGAPNGKTAEEYYGLIEPKVKWVCCCGSGSGKAFPNEPHIGGRSDGEIEIMRHRCAEMISKYPGTIPYGWQVWAKQQLEPPKIRWQDRLARATRRVVANRPGGVTRSWKKLSRKQSACGYGPGRPIIPALSQPNPNIAIAVDTSGSMGPEEAKMVLREVSGILKSLHGSEIIFVAIDCSIHSLQQVKNMEEVYKLVKGGGGTDFRPVFEKFKKSSNPPEIVIFLTDGCGPAPETEPLWCKTIWVLVGGHKSKPCEWGEHILVDN